MLTQNASRMSGNDVPMSGSSRKVRLTARSFAIRNCTRASTTAKSAAKPTV
ncbi:hypothetical protein D3C80_2070130 [compost metagenome]